MCDDNEQLQLFPSPIDLTHVGAMATDLQFEEVCQALVSRSTARRKAKSRRHRRRRLRAKLRAPPHQRLLTLERRGEEIFKNKQAVVMFI